MNILVSFEVIRVLPISASFVQLMESKVLTIQLLCNLCQLIFAELMNKRTRDSRFGDLSTHVDQSVKIKNIDPPEGLEGFYVDDIAVGDTSVLLVLKCKTLRKDPYASRDSETVPESLLILVEYETEEFKVQR